MTISVSFSLRKNEVLNYLLKYICSTDGYTSMNKALCDSSCSATCHVRTVVISHLQGSLDSWTLDYYMESKTPLTWWRKDELQEWCSQRLNA